MDFSKIKTMRSIEKFEQSNAERCETARCLFTSQSADMEKRRNLILAL